MSEDAGSNIEKLTKEERKQINDLVNNYLKTKGLTSDEINKIIGNIRKNDIKFVNLIIKS